MRHYKATRWNAPSSDAAKPVWTRDCKDHAAVRQTTYMEIADIYGTSGCSKQEPYWTYTVLGIIETPRGKLVVEPGDWIVEPMDGAIMVIPDNLYHRLCELSEELLHVTS